MNKKVSSVLLSYIFLMGCSATAPILGLNSGKLMPCPDTPNCVSSQATDKQHLIQPIYFTGTRQEAHVRLVQILNAYKGTKIIVVEENYIRVEFSSKIFQFIDDTEFYFPSNQTEKIFINFRSASRIGYSDLGVNRKRIEQIRTLFKKSNEIL